jgi:methylmalonyl-CoA mutase
MTKVKKQLFSEFQLNTKEQWVERVKRESGKDFSEEQLLWNRDELIIEPYLTTDDVPANRINTVEKSNNDWQIRQDFIAEDFKNTNEKIIKALENGVNALGIEIKHAITEDEMKLLLNGVYLNMVTIHFTTTEILFLSNAFNSFIDVTKGHYQLSELEGSFYVDFKNTEERFSFVKTISTTLPKFKSVTIAVGNESIVANFAEAISNAKNLFKTLIAKDLDVTTIANTIQFKISIGTEYFVEIAKVRALRILWGKLLKQYNINNVNAFIQAENFLQAADNDPYKNILRHTTEAMSAAVGGANILCLTNKDQTDNLSNDFFMSISVNIQNLLKHESHFDKVTDIAAGSYYIESITNQIVEKVWQKI